MCVAPSQIILSIDEAGTVAPPIFTSVGQDAVNGAGDVFVIQSLLNKRLPKPHTEVPVTGNMDPGTILAIKAFQAVMMNMNPPTGYVAPGSPTYYALAARPMVTKEQPPPTRFGHVGIVPSDVIEAAKTSRQRWGIPASITLAQWIVESAWGSAMPPDSNNPFGIKALAKAAGVLFVLGTVSNADADTPTVDAAFAIRAVAVGDFELFGTPTAGSTTDGPVSPVLHTPEATRGKFELGAIVIYDHAEHIVIGQIGVR